MKQRILMSAAASIFLLGIIGSLTVLLSPKKSTVNIISDGKVLYTIDLESSEDRTLVIPFGDSSNTVEIRDGRIRVAEAECPDKTCVRMGWLRSSSMPVVCLPNRLIIEFADGSDPPVDALTE